MIDEECRIEQSITTDRLIRELYRRREEIGRMARAFGDNASFKQADMFCDSIERAQSCHEMIQMRLAQGSVKAAK